MPYPVMGLQVRYSTMGSRVELRGRPPFSDREFSNELTLMVELYNKCLDRRNSLPQAVRVFRDFHDHVVSLGLLYWQNRTHDLIYTDEFVAMGKVRT